jgi:hypothetical protein
MRSMARQWLPRQWSVSRDLTHVMCRQARPSCALSCPSGLPHPDGRSGSSAGWILRLRPPLRVRDANGVNGRRSPWSDGSSAEVSESRPVSGWPANKHVNASRSVRDYGRQQVEGVWCRGLALLQWVGVDAGGADNPWAGVSGAAATRGRRA